jgi:AraC-like DNA-binding protein
MGHVPTVTAITTVHLFEAAARVGVDVQALAARLKLPAAPVFEDRIPLRQLVAAWEAVVEATRDPAFPLRVAAYPPSNARSLVGFLCAAQPTIGASLDTLLRYWPTVTDAYQMSLERQSDRFSLVFDSAGLDDQPGWWCHQEYEMADSAAIARRLVGSKLRPGPVTFRHRAVAPLAEYQRAFGVTPIFDHERTALTFPREVLDEPLFGPPLEMVRVIKERLDVLLAEVEQGSSTSGRVRAALPALLRARAATAPCAARALGLGRRTFERHLDAEGTSFRVLLDEARFSMARSWLDAVAIAEVADRLGYGDVRAFDRAFRRWTGTTPTAWRLAHARNAGRPAPTPAPARGRRSGT